MDSRGLDPAATAAAIVEAAGERPTASVEALGREATTDAALLALAPLGRHVQIGLYSEPPRLAIPRVISQELAVLGSHGMAAGDYPGLLALVREGSLRPQDLVTRTLDLEQACDALVELGERTPAGVGIVRP